MRWIVGLIVGIAWIAAPRAGAEVAIERAPAVIERKTFDPSHRPPEMPPLKPGEAALTQARFDCNVEMTYVVVNSRAHEEKCDTSIRIRAVRLVLHLNVTIWLPQNAPAKLSNHEEGHRQIAEEIYRDAERVARAIARPIDGKTITGTGDDCPAAQKQAVQSAADDICKNYLDRTGNRTSVVGDIYDDLTGHGTRADPAEQEAIRQAFAKEEKSSR
jgi:hypothetical protein